MFSWYFTVLHTTLSLMQVFLHVTRRPKADRLLSKSPPPLCSYAEPNVVYVQWNLGLRTKLSWLFLLWGPSPFGLVTAAKHVMLSFSLPRHAPSKLDGNIILGGIVKVEAERMKQPKGTHGSEGVACWWKLKAENLLGSRKGNKNCRKRD